MNLTEAEIYSVLSGAVTEKIEALEAHLLESEQVEIPVHESLTNGMYTREIIIPKNTVLTGRVHKYPYVDIMLSGDITVATPDGLKRLTGPNICDGKPGRKRAGYAHEATHWVTVHRTDQVELDDMIEHLTFFGMRDYRLWQDRQDFLQLVDAMGTTIEQVREQSEDESDRIDVNIDGVEIVSSDIEGMGVFVTRAFQGGEMIGPARVGGMRTQIGRYANHSQFPNGRMVVVENGDIFLEALRGINPGEEVTVNYRQVRSELE